MPVPFRSGDSGRPRRRALLVAVATALTLAGVGVGASPALAAGQRVNLRVLVVTNGDPGSLAIETELDREGMPYTTVDTPATGRPTIDAAYLEDAATGTARYQAVVLPNEGGGGLAAAEVDGACELRGGLRDPAGRRLHLPGRFHVAGVSPRRSPGPWTAPPRR